MRLLGVPSDTAVKSLYACGRHFSARFRNSLRLSKGAIPDLNLCAPTEEFFSENDISTETVNLVTQTGMSRQIIQLSPENFNPILSNEIIQVSPEDGNGGNCISQIEVENSLENIQNNPLEQPSCSFSNERLFIVCDQGTQTDEYLSENSPRKIKYQEDLNKATEEIEVLKQSVLEKEQRIRILISQTQNLPQQQNNRNIEEVFRNLPAHLAICVRKCIKNYSRDPSGRRFDRSLKTVALGVQFTSPLAYRYLRPLFQVALLAVLSL
ncbi:uncharacterized protein LOC118742361 [Rhagoletis pomonella]|uniref:uncharacterized protein LOC118742361 n=1 Tax=Rhagoletis pomonella TaxID=28610 RepID=UPI0017850666|nr:uncharacterized protein LOC118742361 [Rhagoletis pomonella]